MQHEALLRFAFEHLQSLHVVAGAESGGHQGLSFAAGEDCRSVGARQNADFDPDIANLIEVAAIGTALLFDHLFAENAARARQFVISFLAWLLAAFFVVLRKRGLQFFLEFA